MGNTGGNSTLMNTQHKIKEGKRTLTWTRLSCTKFSSNRVRLALFFLAYNLGNFLRRFALPREVSHWSLRSVQLKLIKTQGESDQPFEKDNILDGRGRRF
jgi:Transposase DDE domain group 1